MDGRHPADRNAVLRARILLAVLAVGIGLLLLLVATRPVVPLTPVVAPGPTTAVRVPPAVQAVVDRIAPHYDGVLRVDRKVVVQLRDVDRPGSYGIPGVTDGTWAIAVVGEMRQTRGVLPIPNSQCRIWFVNSEGSTLAAGGGALSRCDPYFSAK